MAGAAGDALVLVEGPSLGGAVHGERPGGAFLGTERAVDALCRVVDGQAVVSGLRAFGGRLFRLTAGGAISTTSVETEEGQLITRKFFLGSCTFCNTCADFCVKHAIELTQDYHMVARCEDDLVVTGFFLR